MDWLTLDRALEIAGFSIGLLYLYWEYKANRLLWYAGLVMPCISMWVYFRAGLYADFGMNIYYLVMAVYGMIAWRRKDTGTAKTEELPISHFPLRGLWALSLAVGAAYLLLAWVLIRFTNSTVPWLDSLTTALSMAGTWMLARRYIEQWFVWIVVDVISCGLYYYKGIPLYATLYLIYTLIACLGYRKWHRLMVG